MKLFIIGGLATVLTVGGLITSAPPASAGCLYWRQRHQQVRRTHPAPMAVGSGASGLGATCPAVSVPTWSPSSAVTRWVPAMTIRWISPFTDPPTHIDD